jgi:hypothetical protein
MKAHIVEDQPKKKPDYSDLLRLPRANELMFIMNNEHDEVVITLEHRYRDKTMQRYQQIISYEGFKQVQTIESILEILLVNLKTAQKQFDEEEHRHGPIKILN